MGRGGRRRAVALAVLTTMTVAGCDDDGESDSPAEQVPVRRAELADVGPPNAPGQHLYLQEVEIAPNTRLATHYHDGVQIAAVREGTLTYNMLEGEVEVRRADGTTETITAPAVTELGPGDSVVEPADAVHYGENDGDEPVLITLAALVAADAEVSTVVD